MRVCFVSSSGDWGGGEVLLSTLIDALASQGAEATLVARQSSPMAAWGKTVQAPLLELPGRGRRPTSLWRLRRWLVRTRSEIVLLNDPHAITCGGVAALGAGTPRVGMRHTVFPIRSAWKHTHLIDHVVCVSRAAQSICVQAGVPATRCSIIHGAAPVRQADSAASAEVGQMFRRAERSETDKHVVVIGSLLPVKGLDTAIEAVAATPEVNLWIAGDGPLRAELGRLATGLGVSQRVHFLGFRKDIPELLSQADALLSASHHEGLSLVLIEAMLARCPVVATAVGGAREVLAMDDSPTSRIAEVFSPGDSAALSAALRRALRPGARHDRRLEEANAWAVGAFSTQRLAAEHWELYESLLPRRGTKRGGMAALAAA